MPLNANSVNPTKDDEKPIWFLDIDGVVNALPRNGKGDRDEFSKTDVVVFDQDTGIPTVYPIHYRPNVVDFINRVHRQGLAEIQWLTTWGRSAQMFAHAVGIDVFGHTMAPPGTWWHVPAQFGSLEYVCWRPDWWKLQVIRDTPNIANRRFVFTDDDLGREVKAIIRTEVAPKENSLLITPHPTYGLNNQMLMLIDSFLTN